LVTCAAHAQGRPRRSAQAGIAPGSIPHFQVAEEVRRLNRPFETLDVLSRLDPEAGELAGWIFYWIELPTAHHMVGGHAAELEAARRTRVCACGATRATTPSCDRGGRGWA
jgi:hypothetical protein